MTRVQNYLMDHPKPQQELEMSLLEIGINYYHLISLLWNPTGKTYTNEFLIWKTREIIETLVSIAINNDISITDLNQRLLDAIEAFSQVKEEKEIFSLIGIELDNHPNNSFALSLDMKVASLIRLLEFKNISLDQIFEKY